MASDTSLMDGRLRHVVASRKVNAPEGFRWFAFECIRGTDAVKFTGAVPVGVYAKGPRKGRPKFPTEHVVAVVTDAEFIAEHDRFERETGKCGGCMGDGRVMKRWHYQEGTTYRHCSKCGGTGRVDRNGPVIELPSSAIEFALSNE